MEDTELFELCQKVYEKTGWNNTEFRWVAPPLNDTDYKIMHKSKLHQLNDYIANPEMVDKMYNSTFCYDSDYLLEKLPKWVLVMGIRQKITIMRMLESLRDGEQFLSEWKARYGFNLVGEAETPLKALLLLTLALSEAGEL